MSFEKKERLLSQYKEIWEDVVAPAEGATNWEEVIDLLERSAQIVTCILEKHRGLELVQNVPSVVKFFMEIGENGDRPQSQPKHFIRELVHRTLTNASEEGFIGDLYEGEINTKVDEYIAENEGTQAKIELKDLKDFWEKTTKNFNTLLQHEENFNFKNTVKLLEILQHFQAVMDEMEGRDYKETVNEELKKAVEILEPEMTNAT